jgi:DNA-binding SARP family transcriptional activator
VPTQPSEQLVVGLLGPIVLFRDVPVGVPAKLDRIVLTHLLLAEGRAIPVDMLIDAVWAEHPPRQARNALQVKVSRLRSQLREHSGALVFTQGTYRLQLNREQVDAGAFSLLIREASALARARDHDAARTALKQAMGLWRGTPLSELDEHPRIVAARARLTDEWLLAQELIAEVDLATGPGSPEVLARLRKALDHDPLRPKARLLLMQALDRLGRRAEALAVYDAGRRILADQTGLAPSPELQEAFESLLAAERGAASRLAAYEVTRAAPAGAMDTARWLAAEGETSAAIQLAIRGSWWWWFGGERSAGRDLLEELIGTHPTTELDARHALRASAWLAVFEAVEADAEAALRRGEDALRQAAEFGWSKHESLASLLLAERLYQRGAHDRARLLVQASKVQFATETNEWGHALASIVETKALLLSGHVRSAATKARTLVREFEELGDRAGQIMALDTAGYCAEVQGDLQAAVSMHRRALDLARRVQAPEWETSQLTRLGSVLALAGREESLGTLEAAESLASSIRSSASLALARNGLGLAVGLGGDAARSAAIHGSAMTWYETQKSPAGVSYTAGRLSRECDDPQEALRLATKSVALAAKTGDPRAVAHGLEALSLAADDPIRSARALGGARALRRQTNAPLPELLRFPLIERERELVGLIGEELVTELRAGALLSRKLRRAPTSDNTADPELT